MAYKFADDHIVPGKVIAANASDGALAKGVIEIINTYNATCGQEPIMLVGYSRGGATVQNMAWMTWMAQPEVEIDLVVTIAPVEFAHPVFISHKQPNVKRHINLLSGQEWAAIPIGNPEKVYPPDIPLPEFRVPEADIERVYKGTSHFSIIAREMLIYTSLVPVKTKPITPNPVWTLIEAEAAALS